MSYKAINNVFQTPFGAFCFEHCSGIVSSAYFSENVPEHHQNDADSQVLLGLLHDYFYKQNANALQSIKVNPKGTAFQQQMWSELRHISYGETQTYGDLAKRLKTAAQAVGQACRSNPIVVIIPCHRVVSKTGIGGYMGAARAISIKKNLLSHEQDKSGIA